MAVVPVNDPHPPRLRLPAPDGPVDVLVVAGEHSGDEHAARLVREWRQLRPQARVAAIGGPALAGAGAKLLLDLTAHSVVGIVEVLRHYGFFRDLMAETVRWIREHRPAVVCFVDYPGFNLRLARTLRRTLPGGPRLAYYIGPQIWAWKAGRRFGMARDLDALGVIFPFEVDSYADTNLAVDFVGHPFVADDAVLPVAVTDDPAAPVLLLPGSRLQPVGRIFPVLLHGFAAWRETAAGRGARAVVPYPSGLIRDHLQAVLAAAPAALREAVELRPVGAEPLASRAALTSSGTMSLACALAGIPGTIAYRAHPLTFWLGRRLVHIPFLGIANILLNRPHYPEYLQGAATAERLAGELTATTTDSKRRAEARAAAAELRALLSPPAALDASAWLDREWARTRQ